MPGALPAGYKPTAPASPAPVSTTGGTPGRSYVVLMDADGNEVLTPLMDGCPLDASHSERAMKGDV